MTDWYYHDPAQGRVGPHTAQEIGARFRDRRIQRDTLVWNAGMREWQPLQHMRVELDLVGVEPDVSAPPPLPPPPPPGVRGHEHRTAAGAASTSRKNAAPRSRGLSGCAIVAIVLAALAVPAVGIVAAIAIPAYKTYSARANLSSGLYGASIGIGNAVEAHMGAAGRCPGNSDMTPIIERFTQLHPQSKLRFGAADGGHCAFEMTLGGMGRDLDGRTWVFIAYDSDSGTEWDCSGGDLPARLRPPVCRAE